MSQLRLTVLLGFGIPYIPYQKLLCLLLVCTSLTLEVLQLLARRESELFGVSAQTDLLLLLLLGCLYSINLSFIPNLLLCITIILGSGQALFHTSCKGELPPPTSTPWEAHRPQGQWSSNTAVSPIAIILHFYFRQNMYASLQKYHSMTYSNGLQVFFIVHPSHTYDGTHPSLDK